jgi:hypothetical protein
MRQLSCRILVAALWAGVVLAPGCGDDDGSGLDAGLVDAAQSDAVADAAPGDAAPGDAAVADAAVADAAVADAASADAGVPCSVNGVAGECLDVAVCPGVSTPGYCPGPVNIQCCTPDDPQTCDPDAHPQPNAGLVEAPGQGGCPDGMIPVDTFCIDQFEASLWLVHDDETTEPWSPYWNPGAERVRAVSIGGAVPQGYVSGDQAAEACAEAGKRLCTDTEWLRACQGPDETTYPYGDTLQTGVCNDHRAVHPAVEYFGTSADWIWSELGHPCINQLADSLDLTGQNAGCVSAEGALDLMGNLHEWTADPDGTFRGGYYVDTVINGPGCLYRTTAHNVYHWDYSTGFRCCAD